MTLPAIQYRPHHNCREVAAFLGETVVAQGCTPEDDPDTKWWFQGESVAPGSWFVRLPDGTIEVQEEAP